MAMTKAMFILEPLDDFHVFLVVLRTDQAFPFFDGTAIFRNDGREIGSRAFNAF